MADAKVTAGDTLLGITINLFDGGNPSKPLIIPDNYTCNLVLLNSAGERVEKVGITILSRNPTIVQAPFASADLVAGQLLGQVKVLDPSGNFARNPIFISIEVDPAL